MATVNVFYDLPDEHLRALLLYLQAFEKQAPKDIHLRILVTAPQLSLEKLQELTKDMDLPYSTFIPNPKWARR